MIYKGNVSMADADSRLSSPVGRLPSDRVEDPSHVGVSSGIEALDQRIGGLAPGGVYLIAGAPGPAKLVATLQFLHAGLEAGEFVLLLTNARADDLMGVARAWGFDLEPAWRAGRFVVVGFRDDFELRVLRSIEPEDALTELRGLVGPDVARIGVDPGSAFFQGGARTLLGRAFLDWARAHPATFLTTLAIDDGDGLPASTEWLVQATDGILLCEPRGDGLHQIRLHKVLPTEGASDPVTVQLAPGRGLVTPDQFPSRRRADRASGDPERMLLVTIEGAPAAEVEAWAGSTFKATCVSDPLDGVAALQEDAGFGSVLVFAARTGVREAERACRAMRPLTEAPILFASDDTLRSSDRVEILECGADDCVTGSIDFRELATRVRQAVASGGKPAPRARRAERARLEGGLVPGTRFREAVLGRAAQDDHATFCLVRVSAQTVAPPELEGFLASEVRDEQGDLVTRVGDAFLVLLQGARRDPASSFVERLRHRLRGHLSRDPQLAYHVLSHPLERDRLAGALGEIPGSVEAGSVARGGSDGEEA